jgi:hypothetical protein
MTKKTEKLTTYLTPTVSTSDWITVWFPHWIYHCLCKKSFSIISKPCWPVLTIPSSVCENQRRVKRKKISVADLWHFGTDPPIHTYDWRIRFRLRIRIQSFFAYYILKLHLYNFSKIKSRKEVTKQKKSRFFTIFAWWSGSVPIVL